MLEVEVKVPGGRAVGELPGSPGTERSKRAFARSRNSQATFLAIKNYNKSEVGSSSKYKGASGVRLSPNYTKKISWW